jgi:hypothetical protein
MSTLELGPYRSLPTNPERLRDEVARRGLTVTGQPRPIVARTHDYLNSQARRGGAT